MAVQVRQALREFMELKLVCAQLIPLIDACDDALKYVDPAKLRQANLTSEAIDLTRVKITFGKALLLLQANKELFEKTKPGQ